MSSLFTSNFSDRPYWQDHCDDVSHLNTDSPPPATIDVLVVGCGYTGLNAALQLVRSGRSVAIIEAKDVQNGCSARNGGQISGSMKPSLAALSRQHGVERARQILEEGPKSVAWLENFIAKEHIQCDYHRCGSFHGAHSARQFDVLAAQLRRPGAEEVPGLNVGATLVDRSEMSGVLGTDAYYGGVIYPNDASLQPAKYHQQLLRLAIAEGVSVHTHCPMRSIVEDSSDRWVQTPNQRIRARDVIIATNGYTDGSVPLLSRRVIPIGSYMIATEEISESLMRRLMPTQRIICDTRKVVYYYRPSPDHKRIVFGGRVAHREEDARISAPKLHRELCRLFPQLESVKISHSWMGKVAFTFNHLPHRGVLGNNSNGGVYYSMGYCGSGIALSSYFGFRLAEKILGGADPLHADISQMPRRFYYHGRPWFTGAAIYGYKVLDRFAR